MRFENNYDFQLFSNCFNIYPIFNKFGWIIFVFSSGLIYTFKSSDVPLSQSSISVMIMFLIIRTTTIVLFCFVFIRVAQNEQYYLMLWQQSRPCWSLYLWSKSLVVKRPRLMGKRFLGFSNPSIQLLILCPSRHKQTVYWNSNIHWKT